MKAVFKGQVVGEDYTKWPDQLDFSAELSKIRAANPEAVYTFYPGAAGVQFLNQYAQAGLQGKIPLYTTFVVDSLSLPLQKDSARRRHPGVAMGRRSAERCQQEVRRRLHGQDQGRASFYAAQTYDAAKLIASAVGAVKGDLEQAGRGAGRAQKGGLQVRARRLQVRTRTTIRSRTSTCRKW